MNLNELRKIISVELNGLFEAFEVDNNKSFIPPTHISSNSKRALDVVSHNNLMLTGGNEGSGLKKASDLYEKKPHNHSMMKRLKAFFDNNLDNVRKERIAGKNISNSGIIQSWELHGGDAAMKWVNYEIKKVKNSNLKTKENLRKIGGAGINKGLGTMDVTQMDPTKQRIHR